MHSRASRSPRLANCVCLRRGLAACLDALTRGGVAVLDPVPSCSTKGCPVTVYTLDGTGHWALMLLADSPTACSKGLFCGLGPMRKGAVDGYKHRAVAQTTAPLRELGRYQFGACMYIYSTEASMAGLSR